MLSGPEIRATRRALGLTQPQLGQLLGVHPDTIGKWERGKLLPSAYQAAMLSRFGDAAGRCGDVASVLAAEGPLPAVYALLRRAFEG